MISNKYTGSATAMLRERPLMMSDFRGDGGSEITPKNWTLEGKNQTLGGMGGSKIVGHHLWMVPKAVAELLSIPL